MNFLIIKSYAHQTKTMELNPYGLIGKFSHL